MLRVVASAIVALAITVPAAAQGLPITLPPLLPLPKSTPPSQTALAAPPPTSASPLALVDDASVLPVGSVSASISTTVWQGTDLREIFWPVADVAVGLLPHLQITA